MCNKKSFADVVLLSLVCSHNFVWESLIKIFRKTTPLFKGDIMNEKMQMVNGLETDASDRSDQFL